ncbi:RICIN domain-containing protein [Halosimplex aquaticum]|uniref:RICIN domain-containing protein n=1 Tax=Halosimplex aquaticum TaxID=3026162 RepID=A0ABD5Y933_9EURY|nr:RICIN domain-containing protein [Halosimplex aquaticum]
MTRHDRRSFLRLVGASSIGAVATAAASGSASAAPGITSGATYRLTPVHSGKALEVAGAGTADGDNVQQWSWNGGDHQRWIVEELDDGTYRIENVNSGNVLDVPNGDTANGTSVHQWSWNGGDMQRWNITQNSDGSYRVENVASGNVLDVSDWSTADGADVIDWDWLEGDNQRWNFEELSGGDGGSGGGGTTGSGSDFHYEDGFADTSWFSDDVTVHRVTEATQSAVEEAFTASGPRLVVFEASGVIDLGGSDLSITNDQCWVAGQTAPSPGITFTNGMIQVEGNDCIVQHIRIFRGEGGGAAEGADPMNSADGTSNVIFDHCTSYWGRDENLSVGYDSTDTTVANCLIAEGLEGPEENSNGSLIGDGATNVALLGNVWAKNNDRNPRLKDDTQSVIANNVVYYFDKAIMGSSGMQSSIEGNVYLGRFDWSDAIVKGDGTVYINDNLVADPGLNGRTFCSVSTTGSRPLWPSGLSPMASGDVESHNLSYGGARPADRISHEQRVIDEVANRSLDTDVSSASDSDIPNHEDDVGGYPSHGGSTHSLSVPSSGLRDWIEQWALSVEDPNASPP